MTARQMLDTLQRDPFCEVQVRRTSAKPALPAICPADWSEIVETFERVRLFTAPRGRFFSRNSWHLQVDGPPLDVSALGHAFEPPQLASFFSGTCLVAVNARDGGDIVAMNLNTGVNFGCLFFIPLSRGGIGYRCPLIAQNVSEWLDLTYQAGFDSGYYFLDPSFRDRGPIIPGDPEYRGVHSLFEP